MVLVTRKISDFVAFDGLQLLNCCLCHNNFQCLYFRHAEIAIST